MEEAEATPAVLVLTALPRDAELTAHILAVQGVTATACGSLPEAVGQVDRAWCLVVTEEALTLPGYERLCLAVAGQPAWSDFPIILLTTTGSNSAVAHRALADLGNVSLLERPLASATLVSAVNAARRARTKQFQVRESIASISEARDELQRANRAKDELLALVSHELRTPLVSVIGTSDFVRRHLEQLQEGMLEECLEDIRGNGLRLQRVIENMLVLANLEGGDTHQPEPLLLQKFLPVVLERHRLALEGQQTQLCIAKDLPPVLANESYVEQIMVNLLTNARKYGTGGDVVTLQARAAGGFVAVAVGNAGPQVPEEVAARLFEPFFRWEGSAAGRTGLGLGLTVCRRLVEVLGGAIEARPRPAGGLAVEFTLPVLA